MDLVCLEELIAAFCGGAAPDPLSAAEIRQQTVLRRQATVLWQQVIVEERGVTQKLAKGYITEVRWRMRISRGESEKFRQRHKAN